MVPVKKTCRRVSWPKVLVCGVSISFAYVLCVFSGDILTAYELTRFNLQSAVRENGDAVFSDNALLMGPDSRVMLAHGQAYGLRNALLHITVVPPEIKKGGIPLISRREDCFCAFKIQTGRMVFEVSDRGTQMLLLSDDHSQIEKTIAGNNSGMIPDGMVKDIDIKIEDRIAFLAIDGDTVLKGDAAHFDFSMIHLATFGYGFTVKDVTLVPVVRKPVVIDMEKREVLAAGVWRPSRFNSGKGLHNHHFIVWDEGRAGMDALVEVSASDSAIHEALAAVGLVPGNNLTQKVWDRRRNRNAPEPDMRAEGDSIIITLLYGGREFGAAEVLRDLMGNNFDFRFAGNLEHIPVWRSGCVVCLQSCPGSKIANRTYTIRDLEHRKVSFSPGEGLPFTDGDPVIVKFRPAP